MAQGNQQKNRAMPTFRAVENGAAMSATPMSVNPIRGASSGRRAKAAEAVVARIAALETPHADLDLPRAATTDMPAAGRGTTKGQRAIRVSALVAPDADVADGEEAGVATARSGRVRRHGRAQLLRKRR